MKHLKQRLLNFKKGMVKKQRRNDMPKVGKKKYPYTPKGMAAAKKASKKTGKKMTRKRY